MEAFILFIFVVFFIAVPSLLFALLIRQRVNPNRLKVPVPVPCDVPARVALKLVEQSLTNAKVAGYWWQITERNDNVGRLQASADIPVGERSANIKYQILLNMSIADQGSGRSTAEWSYVNITPLGLDASYLSTIESDLYAETNMRIRAALVQASMRRHRIETEADRGSVVGTLGTAGLSQAAEALQAAEDEEDEDVEEGVEEGPFDEGVEKGVEEEESSEDEIVETPEMAPGVPNDVAASLGAIPEAPIDVPQVTQTISAPQASEVVSQLHAIDTVSTLHSIETSSPHSIETKSIPNELLPSSAPAPVPTSKAPGTLAAAFGPSGLDYSTLGLGAKATATSTAQCAGCNKEWNPAFDFCIYCGFRENS